MTILITNHTHNFFAFLQVCHYAFMWLYDVSKTTKLQLVRDVKMGNSGNFKKLEKNAITQTATDNLKLWLISFFNAVYDVLPMFEKNGETCRHLPSWFTIYFVLNEYIKDMEERIKVGFILLTLLLNVLKKLIHSIFHVR